MYSRILTEENLYLLIWLFLELTWRTRRAAAVEYLKKKGFAVEEIRVGSETLLKIGNIYYRIFPMTKTAYKVPIQGVNLVPAYWQ